MLEPCTETYSHADNFRPLPSNDRCSSCFRYYATIQKVTGLSPDNIIGFLLIYLILSAAFWPRGWLGPTEVSTRKCWWGVEHDRCLRLTSPPSVARLFRQCGIPNRSHPYRPPSTVTGRALLFIYRLCSYFTGNTGFLNLLRRQLYFQLCENCGLRPNSLLNRISMWNLRNTGNFNYGKRTK
jgi:hypothetical protein